jgi:hypothetical protein
MIWTLEKCGLAWKVVWPEKKFVATGLRSVYTSHSDVATSSLVG